MARGSIEQCLGQTASLALAALATMAVAPACEAARLDVLGADDAGAGDDASAVPFVDASLSPADYCSGKGAPILVGDRDGGSMSACAGSMAQGAFRYALCTCEGIVSADSIVTDAFDSKNGPYDQAKTRIGGSIGTNGGFNTNGVLDIGGALWASDSNGMTTTASTTAKGELHVNGRVQSGPLLSVGADAFVNGEIQAQGDLTITGTLHQPAGKTASAGGAKSIGASVAGNVDVPHACDCDPALLVDVAAFVEAHRTTNDDAAMGVDPRALENVNTDVTLDVPCGRVFFTRVGGTGAITLKLASGRTAIFVGGDLAPNGNFTIAMDASSEVDVFVEQNLVTAGTFTLGSAANPSNARLYVGGTGTINLPKATTLAGNLYGPRAELVLGGATTVFGSVFVRRLSTQGALTVHYDEGVLTKGDGCPSPSTTCTSCHDCGNQACNAGACGACAQSSDCCAPLQCLSGRCVPSVK